MTRSSEVVAAVFLAILLLVRLLRFGWLVIDQLSAPRKARGAASLLSALMDANYPHGVINHAKGQYVVGAIHTNTIEGFWSIFKRGVIGTFHKVSAKYLPLYVAEFQFRYNNRDNADIFGEAINGC